MLKQYWEKFVERIRNLKNFSLADFLKKVMILARLPVILILTFTISFSISAGSRILHSNSLEKMFPKESMPENSEEESLSLSGRIHRILFLKQEIAEKTSMKHFVPLEKVSARMKEAIVAVEDSRFYSHHGFDIRGIGRAIVVDIEEGELEEGGSTISQQLIKNIFLTRSKSFGRKAEELILAIDLEMNYSKDEILELYLNTIYFGSGFYGIYDASIGYFGIAPSELNLAESAMLAGIPNAPSVYSPYVNFMLAKKRQLVVLESMERAGYITPTQSDKAQLSTIYLAEDDRYDDY